MNSVTYSFLMLMQISFIFGSPLIIPYKCLLWDSPCLTASARAVVPTFTAGVPELGIERLDTMFIDSLHIDQDGYKADCYDIYLQGLRNTIIDNLSIDVTAKVMRLLFHTDISLKAHYVNNGFLLSLPITGEGKLTMELKNVHMDFVIPFEIIKDVNGRDIVDLKAYKYSYDVKDGAHVNFGNLYYGNNELRITFQGTDKQIGTLELQMFMGGCRRMHTLIQQNWKLLTIKYGRYLFDKSNDKIFNTIRNFMRSRPLDVFALY